MQEDIARVPRQHASMTIVLVIWSGAMPRRISIPETPHELEFETPVQRFNHATVMPMITILTVSKITCFATRAPGNGMTA